MPKSSPVITLEGSGLVGSSWVASPEEQRRLDEAERERIEQGVAELHVVLDVVSACWACPTGNGWGHPLGLCPACARTVAWLQAEQDRTETVNGHLREAWCRAYLARQT
jgi:hypothetical protein